MSKRNEWLQAALMTMGQVLIAPMIRLSDKPEHRSMERLTEWINLIVAIIRLINVISRTGWF